MAQELKVAKNEIVDLRDRLRLEKEKSKIDSMSAQDFEKYYSENIPHASTWVHEAIKKLKHLGTLCLPFTSPTPCTDRY